MGKGSGGYPSVCWILWKLAYWRRGDLVGLNSSHVAEWVRPLCKFLVILLSARLRGPSPGILKLYSPRFQDGHL